MIYYAHDGEGIVVASRPSELFDVAGKDIRPEWVARYAGCHYRAVEEPGLTPYENIYEVPFGFRFNDGKVKRWLYPNEISLNGDLPGAYRELLSEAVGSRLTDDSGFTLSGGLDSSTVLALAYNGSPLQAFSTVYEDQTFDESQEIAPMLEMADWHPVKIGDIDVIGTVERMMPHHEMPIVTSTWLAHFLLCEAAAEHGVKTLFGGLGGDELNGGEYEHFLYHFADLRNPQRDREVEAWVRHHDHPLYRKTRDVALYSTRNLHRWIDALAPDYRKFDMPASEAPFETHLKNATWRDLTTETIPPCLRAQEANARAFGMKVANPLLDERLIEFAFSLDGDQKIRDGITKRLLREAMEGILPEETRTRVKKMGWNAPAHLWFVGEGKRRLMELVESPEFRGRGIYDLAEVRRLIDEHEEIVTTGRLQENHAMFLWQLVNLEMWMRWLDRI